MGRRRVEKVENVSGTLDGVVTALCADYGRREAAISGGTVSPRTSMEYRYINHHIYEGALEIVGERYARLYIDEIGNKVGYAFSAHPAVSEAEYKIEKRKVRLNIAKKLHLWD